MLVYFQLEVSQSCTHHYIDFSHETRKEGLDGCFQLQEQQRQADLKCQSPYYFNLSPTHDATITTRNMAKRGLQFDGEYRYLSENFQGTSTIQYLHKDRDSDIDNRYLLNVKHKHNFGHGFTGTIDYENVKNNDNNYFADMSTSIAVTSQVSLRQTAHLDYAMTDDLSDISASFKVQEFQNLTSKSPYELKPSFNVSFLKDWEDNADQALFLQTNANFMYDQFDKGDNAKDNIATGSRISSTPSISFPMEASFGFLKPKLIANLRHYDLDDASTSKKSLAIPSLSLDSGLYLDRPFKLSGYNFTQTLEPRIFLYLYTI